jgi:hypothetical protein
MKKHFYAAPFLVSLFFSITVNAQYPNRCSDISSRNNSNGQSNQCAGTGGTIASNFAGTTYASIPSTAKTADITFKYANTNAATLKPFAITKISSVNGGVSTVINSVAGPAKAPESVGSDATVRYCVYTTNLPTAGTLILELTNPETGLVAGSCSYDATCTGDCVSSTNTILPVRLTDFSAKRSGSRVVLNWKTEEESGIQSYEAERSLNGRQFEKIGSILSRTTAAANTYTFSDQQPSSINDYRLKIVHDNGSFEYSKTIQVKTGTASAVIESITPNPFRGEIAVKISLPKSQVITTCLLDVTGREIKQVKTTATSGTNNISLDNLSNLPNGTYVIKIQTETGVLTQKVTK